MLKIKTPETKPFYLTSEFWLLIASGVNTVASGPQNKEALILNGLAAVYAVARGLAKSGSPFSSPESGTTETLPTDLPSQPGDVPLSPAPTDGSGAQAIPPAQAQPATAAAQAGGETPLDIVRHLLTESPEIIQALRSEGVIQ